MQAEGYCECGCGGRTAIAQSSNVNRGYVKGQPKRFLPSHGARRPLAGRFWAKVDKDAPGGCWLWKGFCGPDGYGDIHVDGKTCGAHRVSYELVVGPIPEGLTLDHLCRNKSCVNPAHLEPVTQAENVLRGISPMANQARQTHCKNGHPFSEDNTYSYGSRRLCRTCLLERSRTRYAAKVGPGYKPQPRKNHRRAPVERPPS